MADPKMSKKKGEVVPFMAHIPSAHGNNTPINSIKLDGPKIYLIWSRQCMGFSPIKGLGDEEQPKPNDLNSE